MLIRTRFLFELKLEPPTLFNEPGKEENQSDSIRQLAARPLFAYLFVRCVVCVTRIDEVSFGY